MRGCVFCDAVFISALFTIRMLIKSILCFLSGFNGIFPLHKATMRGDLTLIDFFLSRGADVNCVNNFNEAPLLFAAKLGSPVVCKFSYKATVCTSRLRVSVLICTRRNACKFVFTFMYFPIYLYIKSSCFCLLQLLHKLIEAGADVNLKDKNDRSVVHLAAQGGSV